MYPLSKPEISTNISLFCDFHSFAHKIKCLFFSFYHFGSGGGRWGGGCFTHHTIYIKLKTGKLCNYQNLDIGVALFHYATTISDSLCAGININNYELSETFFLFANQPLLTARPKSLAINPAL